MLFTATLRTVDVILLFYFFNLVIIKVKFVCLKLAIENCSSNTFNHVKQPWFCNNNKL